MKKNRMMRLASVLMICVLLTTSVISGTFAKYVTSTETEDTARVAKWGIVLTVTGGDTVFGDEYKGVGDAADKVTVKSSGGDVVAPGTKNDTGVTFTLSGTPEVAFKLTAGLETTGGYPIQDIFLADGKYKNETTAANTEDEFILDKTYYPVVFTLVHTYKDTGWPILTANATAGDTINGYTTSNIYSATVDTTNKTVTVKGTLKDINAVLGEVSKNMAHVGPNYVLDDTFKLTWEWVFGDSANHAADTLLGNLAAGTTNLDSAKYNLTLDYNFNITVEQID